uniref:Uncharacterized protein n=1 Tax=Romanomermis culicivorax TaxID=13658 RepID=A0A915KX04_ROMCU
MKKKFKNITVPTKSPLPYSSTSSLEPSSLVSTEHCIFLIWTAKFFFKKRLNHRNQRRNFPTSVGHLVLKSKVVEFSIEGYTRITSSGGKSESEMEVSASKKAAGGLFVGLRSKSCVHLIIFVPISKYLPPGYSQQSFTFPHFRLSVRRPAISEAFDLRIYDSATTLQTFYTFLNCQKEKSSHSLTSICSKTTPTAPKMVRKPDLNFNTMCWTLMATEIKKKICRIIGRTKALDFGEISPVLKQESSTIDKATHHNYADGE